MAIAAVRPGEHLLEELREVGMSAAELARNLGVPAKRVTGILKWAAGDHGGYGTAAGAFLWDERGVLDEFAEFV